MPLLTVMPEKSHCKASFAQNSSNLQWTTRSWGTCWSIWVTGWNFRIFAQPSNFSGRERRRKKPFQSLYRPKTFSD